MKQIYCTPDNPWPENTPVPEDTQVIHNFADLGNEMVCMNCGVVGIELSEAFRQIMDKFKCTAEEAAKMIIAATKKRRENQNGG